MLEQIHLDVFLNLLLKLMKKVFATGCSLVIGTVPHRSVYQLLLITYYFSKVDVVGFG